MKYPLRTQIAALRAGGMTYEQIRALSFWQLAEIEGHDRTREGMIDWQPEEDHTGESAAQGFRSLLRAQGLPEWFIDRRQRAVAGQEVRCSRG